MKITTMINRFFMQHFETTSRKRIADTWGERIKPIAGTDKIEIGTTYFYECQNHTQRVVNDFIAFAAKHGVIVTCPTQEIKFHRKNWPTQSWATMYVVVEIQEEA